MNDVSTTIVNASPKRPLVCMYVCMHVHTYVEIPYIRKINTRESNRALRHFQSDYEICIRKCIECEGRIGRSREKNVE